MRKYAANSSRSCGSVTGITSLGHASWSFSLSAAGAVTNGGRPNRAQSGAAFEQAVTLAEAGKHEEAAAAFAKLASDGTPGYRLLARLREAAELAQSDGKAAIAAYDAIATDNRAGQVIQDLAAVRAGYLLIDSTPYSEMVRRLEPLAAPDRPFRHSARDILALSAWKAGDAAMTRRWTDMMMSDPQTPPGPRSRAQILSELIAASAKG